MIFILNIIVNSYFTRVLSLSVYALRSLILYQNKIHETTRDVKENCWIYNFRTLTKPKYMQSAYYNNYNYFLVKENSCLSNFFTMKVDDMSLGV